VFTSPTPDQMLAAANEVDAGAGVLFIVKNDSGDMVNFQMAAKMLEADNAPRIKAAAWSHPAWPAPAPRCPQRPSR
jgi:dihydroxyacetone kinase